MAAFLLNALIHPAIPAAFSLSFHIRDVNPALLGLFRPETFLTTYFYLSLPVAFVATALPFSAAVLERNPIVAYVLSILLFPVKSLIIWTTAVSLPGNWELAMMLIDLVGISIIAGMVT